MKNELAEWKKTVITLFPGNTGEILRASYYRKKGAFIDPTARILNNVTITRGEIVIGARSTIGQYSILDATGGIIIESDVLIAPCCLIYSADHNYKKDMPIRQQGYRTGKVTIRSGAWIGARSIILQGVTIGENAVVAAGSVVTKNVKQNEVVAGVPAKLLGK